MFTSKDFQELISFSVVIVLFNFHIRAPKTVSAQQEPRLMHVFNDY